MRYGKILAILLFSISIANADDCRSFRYSAIITSVHDGDTVTAQIKLGLNVVLFEKKVQLFGIDAPEIYGKDKEKGIKARNRLRQLVNGRIIVLRTIEDKIDESGGILAVILLDGFSINDRLVAEGFAKFRQY